MHGRVGILQSPVARFSHFWRCDVRQVLLMGALAIAMAGATAMLEAQGNPASVPVGPSTTPVAPTTSHTRQ